MNPISRFSYGALAVVAAVCACSLSGCGSSSAPSSEADRAAFRGDISRLPAADRKKVEASIQASKAAAPSGQAPSPEQIQRAKQAERQAASKGG